MIRYILRAAKYFLLLSVLYLAIMAAMYYTGNLSMPLESDFWQTLNMQLFFTQKGRLMIPAILLLSICYPRFGFVSRVVAPCNLEQNLTQVENAFMMAGFKPLRRSEGEIIFVGESLWQRAMCLWEDEIVVRSSGDGVEIEGIRRAVVKIAWRLDGYMSNLKS